MGNMDIYEALATPPNDALKPIGFGNLKGKSDINPQWRYEAITNKFGMCGVGWKYTIDSHWIQPIQQTGEIMVYVMISFYTKQGEMWSEPIPAYGGDFLVKKDKNGIHGNDEAMKMAVTDALGTAMKMIGVAADVYRGLIANGASDSKYARRDYAAQTSQNRPQGAANIDKGSSNTNVRESALKQLMDKAKKLGLNGGEISAIAGLKFGKVSDKEMTVNELCQMANNLEAWVAEQTGASA